MSQRVFSLAVALLAWSQMMPAQTLRHDPFQLPADLLAEPATNTGVPLAPGARPQILGILVTGGEALVNLGGEVIAVGEESGGYRLLEVGEERAVFVYKDEIVTLELYPDEGEESNEG